MRKLLLAIAKFLGNRAGRVNHFFKGCKSHWTYVKGKNSKKFNKRICHWCGKREDRINGKWKHIGRYKRSKK